MYPPLSGSAGFSMVSKIAWVEWRSWTKGIRVDAYPPDCGDTIGHNDRVDQCA